MRTISITGEITATSARLFVLQLRASGTDETIAIRFDSQGGLVSAARDMAAEIRKRPGFTGGIAIGNCCSAATIPFLACRRRIASQSAEFLLHQSASVSSGKPGIRWTSTLLRRAAGRLAALDDEVLTDMAEWANIDKFVLIGLQREGAAFDAARAFELGLVDEVEGRDDLRIARLQKQQAAKRRVRTAPPVDPSMVDRARAFARTHIAVTGGGSASFGLPIEYKEAMRAMLLQKGRK